MPFLLMYLGLVSKGSPFTYTLFHNKNELSTFNICFDNGTDEGYRSNLGIFLPGKENGLTECPGISTGH